jgi:eukaryotic-like serine/threonine-protein kinase
MTPERWRQLDELYDAVRDLPAIERSQVMEHADPEVRANLEAILAQDRSVLDHPVWESGWNLGETQMGVASGRQLGPYKIEQLLGAGGMGEVYRAVDTRLGRTVAVKVLPQGLAASPEFRHRFLREARAASALNHPNIVVLFDISSHEGVDFLVMEYVAGQSLKDLIPPEGLAFDQLIRWGAQIASALEAAHASGIVHRDVKPANIVVTAQEQVKVLDFGIAKVRGDGTATDLTNRGQVIGTVTYMSPEQTRGEDVDARSDIFSLGCLLYEAATGQTPFRGVSALAVMHEIATADPPPPSSLRPNLPRTFDAMIARCLRKLPQERFSSMAEVRANLEQPVSVVFATAAASIVVLPFTSAGTDRDTEHFGDGLAEELIAALTKISKLRVTPRSSAFSFRGKSMDVREIGRRLNAGSVLEGNVRGAGSHLRISVQLTNVADGRPLWSERFDRTLTDIFEVQDEITGAVVAKLCTHLLGEAADVPGHAPKRFTEDPEAYSLFLKGRYHWNRRPSGTYAAIGCFQRALERDPKYALAYASLSDCYNTLGSWEAGILAPEEAYSKGRAYAERSLQIDPHLAEGHTAMGYGLFHFAWDLRAAERSMTEAIRLDPGYGAAHHWYSHLLVAAQRFEESLEQSRQYLSLDPTDPKAVSHLCWDRLMAHDFPAAERECRAAVIQEPNFAWHHTFLGWALLVSGRPEEAHAEMEEGVKLSGNLSVFRNFATHACAVWGHGDLARAQLKNLEQISQQKYVSPYEIGLIHEALGNREEAFLQWERAFEQRSPWLVYLANEPRLMHLRGQPQFDALVGRIQRIAHRATVDGCA